MNAVLLAISKERVEALRAASRRKGLMLTVVPDERQASSAMAAGTEGILVVDSSAAGDLSLILKNRPAGWPALILTARFDSSVWVEMFKAGASEVISDPLTDTKLDTALDALAKPPATPSRVETRWRVIARHLGFAVR